MTVTAAYAPRCRACSSASTAMRGLHFVALQSAEISGAPPIESLAGSLHAVDGAGGWFRGARAVVEIGRRVPALRLVAVVERLPGAMAILEVGYELVADNRQRISRVLGLKACRVLQSRT